MNGTILLSLILAISKRVIIMIIRKFYESSFDGTLKYQILTYDNYIIEACVVFFWEKKSPINICISSQVGCECTCSFCVTGNKKFIRNLLSQEIVNQITLIFNDKPDLLKYDFEITYMGTGEPLQNWVNVLSSARFLSEKYQGLKQINISSIFPRLDLPLKEIFNIRVPIRFQFSLHFISDELRLKYFRRKLPSIELVLELLNSIYKGSNNLYCINYILFDKINDQYDDAKALARMVQKLPAYLKISQYCPIECCELMPSQNYTQFVSILSSENIKWKSFKSKGIDIQAACGHLLSDIQF